MEGNYEVNFGGQAVGKVQVRRQGLYYVFHCRCRLTGEVVSKLVVHTGNHQENLGILVPMGDGFGLDTKVPVKKLGEGIPSFQVVPNRVVLQGQFVPIRAEEPFAYITRLQNAFLARLEGEVGAVIQENPGT